MVRFVPGGVMDVLIHKVGFLTWRKKTSRTPPGTKCPTHPRAAGRPIAMLMQKRSVREQPKGYTLAISCQAMMARVETMIGFFIESEVRRSSRL